MKCFVILYNKHIQSSNQCKMAVVVRKVMNKATLISPDVIEFAILPTQSETFGGK